jgi:hypothetical protein
MKLIKDLKYIREDYRVNEGLIEFETNKLKIELGQIEDSSIVALVGAYGAGKSTTLYNIGLEDTDETHRWFQFDAWRYPERKGLWDGLIIELAKEIGVEHKAARKIDGNRSIIGKWGGIVGELFSQFGESLPKAEIDKITLDPKVAESVAKVSDKASSIFGRSPAKRAYELERILADVLLSVKEQAIYIVAEDVDRSGSDGIHFLETLNYFLKNNEQLTNSEKKIIVIAPISDKVYANSERRESLYKCVDIFIEYKPLIKSSAAFLKNVFTDEALGRVLEDEDLKQLGNIEGFVNTLLETESFQINIRKLKLIFRHTNQKYLELLSAERSVDWRAILVIESMRIAEDGAHDRSLLVGAKHSRKVKIRSGTIFSALLRTIHNPNEGIFRYKYSNDRSRENREINAILGYESFSYKDQSHPSVWEGYSNSQSSISNGTTGYVADYYFS